MTATTYRDLSGARPWSSFGGWLRRTFWRIAEAREKQARERIARDFRGQDDEHLKVLGYSANDISRIRRG